MKRKIAMLTALLALTMTFAACGNNGSDAADTSAPEASVSESETSAEETSDTEEDILPDESESIEGADEAVPDDGLIDDAFGVDDCVLGLCNRLCFADALAAARRYRQRRQPRQL